MRHLEVLDVHILTMRIVTLIEAGRRIQGANQDHKSKLHMNSTLDKYCTQFGVIAPPGKPREFSRRRALARVGRSPAESKTHACIETPRARTERPRDCPPSRTAADRWE